jgi:hypothetical protein
MNKFALVTPACLTLSACATPSRLRARRPAHLEVLWSAGRSELSSVARRARWSLRLGVHLEGRTTIAITAVGTTDTGTVIIVGASSRAEKVASPQNWPRFRLSPVSGLKP